MARKVLLVDDEPGILRVVGKRLALAGYQVVTAAEGHEALEAVRREKPQLIVLDLMLPGLNGVDVCTALKHDAQYRHIPIIIFTGKGKDIDETLCREVGAEAYLNKGPASELLEQLEALLQRFLPPEASGAGHAP